MKSSDFLQNDRFKDYLLKTKMYKEMYSSKEGILSIIISILFSLYILHYQGIIKDKDLSSGLYTFLGILIAGGFGLLGFSIGGLGILLSSISDNLISLLDKENKFLSLFRIVFRFYYDGAMLVSLIFICTIDVLILLISNGFNIWAFAILGFFTTYFFCYSLLLSVMLMGSSIRLMILKHHLIK